MFITYSAAFCSKILECKWLCMFLKKLFLVLVLKLPPINIGPFSAQKPYCSAQLLMQRSGCSHYCISLPDNWKNQV